VKEPPAPVESFDGDLIDRIASALPASVRPDYYRELRHCRSLPENDEMLRILRAMQFSVLLMVQAPERMAAERQRLEESLHDALQVLRQASESSRAHQKQLDRRLAELPAEIAKGIEPEAIAETINESLRQQFVQSTIPTTAEALDVAAAQIRKATADFGHGARTLGQTYQSAVTEAREAVDNLHSVSSRAVSNTREAAQQLVEVFRAEYRWSLYTLTVIALLMGIGIGMLFERWLESPPQSADRTSVVQPAKPRSKP
jgi:hypothetical protein